MNAVNGHNAERTLYCSFCLKSQHQVAWLLCSALACICDECLDQCAAELAQRRAAKDKEPSNG